MFVLKLYQHIFKGNLEKVLPMNVKDKDEFGQQMEDIKSVCNMDFNGNMTFKDVHLLVIHFNYS